MKRSSWLDVVAAQAGQTDPLTPRLRQILSRLDDMLFSEWNLGENTALVWTRDGGELRFVSVRHYAIIEAFSASGFINQILAGPKFVAPADFQRICQGLGEVARIVGGRFEFREDEPSIELVSSLVTRYGVSLVQERAVLLLDAVGFSLCSPLEQVAMLNSLSHSVNSAYRQLLSEDVRINFARTTTGDGFYIWNRARTVAANIALYELMMLILADNAVARSKAKRFPVPELRAAFHVGEHYEFYQVEALNPTTFGYIVGQVTIDLSRMIEKALPGQIVLGEFNIEMLEAETGDAIRHETLGFVEKTAATLDKLRGLVVGGDRIEEIRCYLTGESLPNGGFLPRRYHISDKHGKSRSAYNAKINIHRHHAEPIFLGIQHKDLHPAGIPPA